MSSRDDRALRLADQEARRRACLVFDRPLVLEAGAGTGKTAVLVARTLAWLLGPGWEAAAAEPGRGTGDAEIAARALDGLVAITFTETAAAEMADRIAGALATVVDGGEPLGLPADLLPAESRETARLVLAALDRLRVQTIHAFCRALLTSHPLESGIHPRFLIDADGEATDEIVREVLDQRLRDGYRTGDPALLSLAAAGHGPGEIADALGAFRAAGGHAADLAPDPLAPSRVASLLDRVDATLGDLARRVAPRLAGRPSLGKPQKVAADLAACAALAQEPEPRPETLARLAEAASRIRELHGAKLGDWRRGSWSQAESAAFGEEAPAIAERSREVLTLLAHLERLDPALLAAARTTLQPLLAEVESRRRVRGLVSFDDLQWLAVELLRRHPALCASVRRGLRQILVDEFQDTDPLQCQLLELLALDAPPEERPGLFLVGDPKQSIYGWRRADLAAYQRFVERALASEPEGERATLTVNFRSVPAVLAEVERAVAPCFRPAAGLQPEFAPLLACEALEVAEPHPLPGGRAAVEHWVSWAAEGEPAVPRRTRVREADRLEARAIAEDLAQLHELAADRPDEPWCWSDVALIFRVSTAQEVYLEALRERRIPFQIEGDRSFYQRREVIDATSLIRAVLDPGDALALVATLRSPWVGVPDAALLPLWDERLPRLVADLSSPEPAALAPLRDAVARAAAKVPAAPGLDRVADWPILLVAACEGIAALRRAFRSLPADRFVAELRHRFPFEAISAARWLGRFRLANLERWCDRLLAALLAARGDVDAVLRRLRRAVAEGEEDAAGAAAAGPDAVRVLTIHKAKGLDFVHVYLPQLHHGSAGGRADDALFQGGSTPEYALFGLPTPGLDTVAARRARVAAAERVRLLYVASTRAKRRVVLLGAGAPHGPDDRQNSLLALLDSDRLRRIPAATGEVPARDEHGVRWRILGLERPPAQAAATREPAVGPAIDPEATRTRFAHRRLEAEALAGRPWVAGVTASLLHSTEDGPVPASAASGGVAVAVGSAIHRFLELLDPLAAPAEERRRLAERMERELARRLPTAALREARELLESTLDGLHRGGRLLLRLREIAPWIVARELPLLLPGSAASSDAPTGAHVGTLDLLYRDPRDGRPVVVDFKTDRGDGSAPLAERIAYHGPQLRTYGRAVAQALGLGSPPRLELWLLAADRALEVPLTEDDT